MSEEQDDKALEQRMREHADYENRLDKLYENLRIAQDFVWERRIKDAERYFYDYCANLSGTTIADTIKAVDFSKFQSEVRKSLNRIVSEYIPRRLSTERPVKAIYYEYDPDNGWSGHFFVCLDYAPVDFGDDDWACDWKEHLEGPTVPEYGDIVLQFLESNQSLGNFSYAVVRVYLEFAKACFEIHCPVPVCIGFHEQSYISRVFRDLSRG